MVGDPKSGDSDGDSVTRSRIESLRGVKNPVDPWRPIDVIGEVEPVWRKKGPIGFDATGGPVSPGHFIAPDLADCVSIFLAGAECAFRCSMCDLWRHTIDGATPPGALPEQIRIALAKELPRPELPQRMSSHAKLPRDANDEVVGRWVKLYNSSNFFDPRCVPREDWDAIADLVSPFGRVIVENHPRMVGDDVGRFAARIAGRLEVAMGLETVYEPSIRLLNKQMSLEDFERAAARLKSFDVDLRVFILVQPPGMAAGQGVGWAVESVRFARRCGARHASLIATRGGNGMMESFSARGLFTPPRAECLEDALAESMRMSESMRDPMGESMVVTADLWDFQRLAGLCDRCVEVRRRRLFEMNLSQRILPPWESDCACRDESL